MGSGEALCLELGEGRPDTKPDLQQEALPCGEKVSGQGDSHLQCLSFLKIKSIH